MGVRDNAINIFEEQRALTDDEMQAYKDMLRRKEKDMEIKATESRFNQTVQKDQATLIAELISRVTSLEDTVESILERLQKNTAENTNEIQSKPTATKSTEVPWWMKGR